MTATEFAGISARYNRLAGFDQTTVSVSGLAHIRALLSADKVLW
jgi:hypothetical protein